MKVSISLLAALSLSVFSFHHGFAGPQSYNDSDTPSDVVSKASPHKHSALSEEPSSYSIKRFLVEQKPTLERIKTILEQQEHVLTHEEKQKYIGTLQSKIKNFVQNFKKHPQDEDAQQIAALFREIMPLLGYKPKQQEQQSQAPGFSAKDKERIKKCVANARESIRGSQKTTPHSITPSQTQQVNEARQALNQRPTSLSVSPSPKRASTPTSENPDYDVPALSPRRVNTPTSENADYDVPKPPTETAVDPLIKQAGEAAQAKRKRQQKNSAASTPIQPFHASKNADHHDLTSENYVHTILQQAQTHLIQRWVTFDELKNQKKTLSPQQMQSKLLALEANVNEINTLPDVVLSPTGRADSKDTSIAAALQALSSKEEEKNKPQEVKELIEKEGILKHTLRQKRKELSAAQKEKDKLEAKKQKAKKLTKSDKRLRKENEKSSALDETIERLTQESKKTRGILEQNMRQQIEAGQMSRLLTSGKAPKSKPRKGRIARLFSRR